MIYIDGTDNYPPLLHTEDITGPTVFPNEFFPLDERHNEPCEFDTLVFYDIADDLMSSDYYQYNFSDDYFAIYVMRACSTCGDIEWLDEDRHVPMLYTQLITNTPENRVRFFGTEEDSDSTYSSDESSSYDPEWSE